MYHNEVPIEVVRTIFRKIALICKMFSPSRKSILNFLPFERICSFRRQSFLRQKTNEEFAKKFENVSVVFE